VPKHYDSDLDRIFSALGDATRRDVIQRLLAEGEATVGVLAEAYAMSRPSFSEHLGALEKAGLIERSRDGRHHRIGVKPEGFSALRDWLDLAGLSAERVAQPPPTTAVITDPDVLARAEALMQAAAPKLAIVAQVLDPASRRAMVETTAFSPEAHAVRRLAAAAHDSPGLRGELTEAHTRYVELAGLLGVARVAGATDALAAAVFPLARCLYAWQSHAVLKDAFPLAGPAMGRTA
jgi:DNA-binding transcriptional ArsR family regulator